MPEIPPVPHQTPVGDDNGIPSRPWALWFETLRKTIRNISVAELAGVVPITSGGTNSSTSLFNNRVMQSSAGSIVEAAAITANRALASDTNGIPIHSTVTTTELNYVSGVTSSIQTQISSKLANSLANGKIFIGDASNIPQPNSVTGDISITNAGVTSYSSTVPLNKGGTGQTTKAASFDALSPMSASGDIIYGGALGTGTRLPKGSDGQYLTLSSGLPAWAAATFTTTNPTVQTFTSGSGTYTTPANVKWIKVTVIAGGGGGQGSGTTAGTGQTAGGNSTFGSSLLTANGGSAAATNVVAAGGTATVSSPAVKLFAITGNSGGTPSFASSVIAGGAGGSSILGGAGSGGYILAGGAGATNSGSGGGGGGGNGTASYYNGGGGASGGCLVAIITSPSASYSYAVGAGGTGGAAGSGGTPYAGGAGAAGVIIVEEYYQ